MRATNYHQQGCKVSDPKFIIDFNAGRLAKWLRIMGYDTTFVPGIEDGELVSLALEEGRILLTRDRDIMKRRPIASGEIRALLLESDHIEGQLRRVVEAYHLDIHRASSRCIACNLPLRRADREDIRERVPPYVFRTQAEIEECPSCRKPFWRGTHWRNVRRELARLNSS